MHVPFVNIKTQYQAIKPEIDAALASVFSEGQFVGGPVVDDFEEAFAEYVGVSHCVSCGNGTDAMEIALEGLGIGVGDEVIVPAMSWISTAEVVRSVGARVIFADILPDLFTIDPADIERKITSKTKAIIPVHFYGRPAEMDQVLAIAKKHHLKIIEDCAQAHGAKFDGQSVGSFGDVATFSFYPSKNLGAFGDAGGIVTSDGALAKSCRVIANHGQEKKHHHLREGRNSRMDTIQAAMLKVKLKYLEEWTETRIEKAKYYNGQLTGLPLAIPIVDENHRHVYHLFTIQVENRDQIQAELTKRGVDTQVHNPQSLPALIPYHHQCDARDYPVAQQLAAKTLSLPFFPEITRVEQDYVVAMVRGVLEKIN